jgi:hypothetical protein
MTASWGPDPMVFARELHGAVQQQQQLNRDIGALQHIQPPRPEPGLAFLTRTDNPVVPSPFDSDPRDTNRDGTVSFMESLGRPDISGSPPAAWGSQPHTLPFRPSSHGIFGIGHDSPNAKEPPLPPVDAAHTLIPDPVEIVAGNYWPPGMLHWGLAQKIAWLDAITHPYIGISYEKSRLEQAHGMLYQQYGVATGRAF